MLFSPKSVRQGGWQGNKNDKIVWALGHSDCLETSFEEQGMIPQIRKKSQPINYQLSGNLGVRCLVPTKEHIGTMKRPVKGKRRVSGCSADYRPS